MNSIRFVLYNKTYLAYLNEEYIGGIYKSEFKNFGLNVPEAREFYINDISDETITMIKEKVYDRAYNKAIGYVSTTECSADTIRTKLRMKRFPEQIIDQVIDVMIEYGYLSDSRFVESFVRSYIRKKSRRLIEKEISDRGIDCSKYQELIDNVYQDEGISEEDVIEGLINKKFRDQDLRDIKVKKRFMSYMMRHGFGYDKINNYLT